MSAEKSHFGTGSIDSWISLSDYSDGLVEASCYFERTDLAQIGLENRYGWFPKTTDGSISTKDHNMNIVLWVISKNRYGSAPDWIILSRIGTP